MRVFLKRSSMGAVKNEMLYDNEDFVDVVTYRCKFDFCDNLINICLKRSHEDAIQAMCLYCNVYGPDTDCVVMRDYGQKDCNGKLIHDGDIVSYDNKLHIYYGSLEISFLSDKLYFQIIGNIFENRKLADVLFDKNKVNELIKSEFISSFDEKDTGIVDSNDNSIKIGDIIEDESFNIHKAIKDVPRKIAFRTWDGSYPEKNLEWTKKEEAILINNYNISTDEKTIELLPDRTIAQIKTKYNQMIKNDYFCFNLKVRMLKNFLFSLGRCEIEKSEEISFYNKYIISCKVDKSEKIIIEHEFFDYDKHYQRKLKTECDMLNIFCDEDEDVGMLFFDDDEYKHFMSCSFSNIISVTLRIRGLEYTCKLK